jgi:hypothetical protein
MTTTFPDSLVPTNDAARLRTLHQYDIVNTTSEPIFDDYTAWAAQLFNTPISLISLVDDEYVWFKSVTGAEGIPGLPRAESMCSAAILQDDAVVTSDYKPESCTLIKPDVAQAIGLKFYAGAALQMPDGARVGMLAVIGREFRTITDKEEAVLARLAQLVSQTIELRVGYLRAGWPTPWTKMPPWPATSAPATTASTSTMTTSPSSSSAASTAWPRCLSGAWRRWDKIYINSN